MGDTKQRSGETFNDKAKPKHVRASNIAAAKGIPLFLIEIEF